MKNMTRHRNAGTLASAVGLLVLSLGLCAAAGRVSGNAGTAPLLEGLQDAAVPAAGDASPAPSPPRRLNSSLSMPYFSFAQSLNSRS